MRIAPLYKFRLYFHILNFLDTAAGRRLELSRLKK